MRPLGIRLAIPRLDWLELPAQLTIQIGILHDEPWEVVLAQGPLHHNARVGVRFGPRYPNEEWQFYVGEVATPEHIRGGTSYTITANFGHYRVQCYTNGHDVLYRHCEEDFLYDHVSDMSHIEMYGSILCSLEYIQRIESGQEPSPPQEEFGCQCYVCLELDEAVANDDEND